MTEPQDERDRATVLVTGATGKTGRRVARLLAGRGLAVRAVSRSTAPRFDWYDGAGWEPVLRGVTAAYLVVPDLGSPRLPPVVAALARRAAAAGVGRAVLLSTGGGSPWEEGVLAAERALAGAGLAWTVLRPRWFHQNFSEDFLRGPVMAGEVRLSTGEGREAFIDADDIAEVAVAALTEDGHAGRRYELTGPRPLSFGEAVGEVARASGRAIRYVPVTAKAYAGLLRGRGMDPESVALLVGLFERVSSGALASVTGDVERVLGRAPRDFTAYARAAAAAGAWRT
nr:NAD(P)H-binding protein [Streptomyces sp. SBT349]